MPAKSSLDTFLWRTGRLVGSDPANVGSDVQETLLDEEEGEAQEADARDAIVTEDGEWGLEARKAIREFEDQLMIVDGEVVDLDNDDPEQEICE